MTFTFDWNILTVFEVLGIALAVIGFFNLSEKLETMFANLKTGFTKYAKYEIENAKQFWPPHKNIKRLFIDMMRSMPVHLTILLAFIIWKDGLFLLWNAYASLDLGMKIIVAILITIGFLLNELFTHYVLTRVFALIATVFEKLFHILGIPPSGVTGTLGLLITLISFGLGHLSAV